MISDDFYGSHPSNDQLAHHAGKRKPQLTSLIGLGINPRTDAVRQPPNTREGCLLCPPRRVSLPFWSHIRLRQSSQVLYLEARPSLSRERRSGRRPSPGAYGNAANTNGGPNDRSPTRTSESRRHAHARIGDPARRHHRRPSGWWCRGRAPRSGVRRNHGTLGGGGAAVARVCGVCSRCGG